MPAGELAAIGSAALWAVSSLIMAGCTRRMPALALSSLRLLYGTLFYAVALALTGDATALLRVGGGTVLAISLTSVLSLGVGDTMYIAGMHRIGVARASPISVTCFPLLTVVLAWALLGERITLATAFGGLLVIGGIVLVVARPRGVRTAARAAPLCARSRKDTDAAASADSVSALIRPALPLSGLLLVVAATVTWACSTVWLRTLATGVDAVVVNSVRVPVTAVFLTSAAAGRGLLRMDRYRRRDIALIGVAGLAGSGLGSVLYVYALDRIGAGESSLLNSLSPVFALPLAALFLRERITRQMLAGTVLALCGAWLFLL